MNLKRAEAILKVALEERFITEANYDTLDKIELADYLYKEAQKHREQEGAKKILFAAEVESEGKPQSEDDKVYREAIKDNLPENLPVPPEIEGDAPVLPLNLNELADKEVMFLHGAFNACAARLGYLFSIEKSGENASKHIADHHFYEYLRSAERKDPDTKKPKTMEVLRAEGTLNNENIAKWRKLQHQHELKAERYKQILDQYTQNCEILSRHWTMRINERENS